MRDVWITRGLCHPSCLLRETIFFLSIIDNFSVYKKKKKTKKKPKKINMAIACVILTNPSLSSFY
jgi:hypothetical protein